MDSTQNNLTLNKKCLILLEMLEQHFTDNKKYLSGMLKAMYKPAFATIKTFLSIMPEQDLQKKFNYAAFMHEAIMSKHTEEEEFKTHIQELMHAWI